MNTTPAPWNARLHFFTVLTALSTLFLIFAGGMVTSTGSGLSVPDWPLSYGMVMPPMVGGIFYEHGHRMIATAVGFLTLVQALWIWRAEDRPWLRKLGMAALALVIFQGVLGGMTVLLKLPPAVSVFHAFVAQSFFCLSVFIACATSRRWREEPLPSAARTVAQRHAAVVVGALFVQLLLGAVMRHKGAGLAVVTFPLLGQGPWPPLNFFTAVHMAHRYWAMVVAALVIAMAVRTLRSAELAPRLYLPVMGALALLVAQIALGALTIVTARTPVITSLHVMTGAALLGTVFYLAVWTWRLPVGERSTHPGPAPDAATPALS